MKKAAERHPNLIPTDPLDELIANIKPEHVAALGNRPNRKKPELKPQKFPDGYILDKNEKNEIILRPISQDDVGNTFSMFLHNLLGGTMQPLIGA